VRHGMAWFGAFQLLYLFGILYFKLGGFMAVRVFDTMLIAVGAVVYTKTRPHGVTITQAFERQCHWVIPENLSPPGFGGVVAWRNPNDVTIYNWTESSNATVTVLREG